MLAWDIWIKRIFYFCVIACAGLLVCMNSICLGLLLILAAVFIPHRFHIPHFLPVLFVVSTAVHLIAVFTIHTPLASDFERMYNAAVQAANGDFSFQNTTYFFQWAYQTGFVLWEALLIKVFGSMASIKIANALMLSAINCLIYLLARRFVDQQAAQTAALLYLVTVFPTLLTCVLTNQHISAFCFVLALYVLTGGKKAFSIPRALAAGVLLAFGNVMRPEGIVIIAGLCGTAVFVLIMRRSLRGSARMLCGVVIAAVMYFACTSAASWAVAATGINQYGLSNNWPEWKFIVGFNSETCGWYSEEDRNLFAWAHQIDTPPEVTAASLETEKQLIHDRIFTTPIQFLRLMAGKAYYLWIGEGLGFPLGYINNTDTKIFGIKGTKIYQYFVSVDRTVFAVVLMLALLGAAALFRRKAKEQTFSTVLAPMTVLAFFSVFLLVEIQPRYVFLPQIFLYITAAAGVSFLKSRWKTVTGRRRNTQESEQAS